jgi:hypothetical protein
VNLHFPAITFSALFDDDQASFPPDHGDDE